jgi:hypothetical protein
MGFFRKYVGIIVILVLFFAQAALFCVIPLMGSGVFLSPDETATAVSARSFATRGSMRIVDPILKDGPWLRPRSFVTQGDAMVPVGFLGLPIVLGALSRVFGEFALLFLVPLLVLSAGFPIWRFLRSSGRGGQIAGVTMWLAFPTVILYANRGLYPNLPVVCLGLWATYLLWEKRSIPRSVVAGLAAGLAIAIRPVESAWLIPWLAVAWRFRTDRKQHQERVALGVFAVCLVIPLIIAAVVAWKTYGSPFAVGYFLRDSVVAAPGSSPASSFQLPTSSSAFLPFGFHPRAMWFNVRAYFFGEWLPWSLIAIVSAAVIWKRREGKMVIALSLWTMCVGVLIYGQSIYQDHVGINVVSSGNSFLRYLIPLAAVFALAFGIVVGWAMKRFEKRRLMRILLITCVALFVAGGTKFAFDGDDENIMRSAQELERYHTIRDATYARFGPQTIVLSDRSDKIFFPLFRVASPLPSKDLIAELTDQAQASVTVFTETLDDNAMSSWKNAGIQLRPVLQNDNQTLYVLSTVQASLK